jgi:hypothetical protein
MSFEGMLVLDERSQAASVELRRIIAERYPDATFELAPAPDDPHSIHLIATVDVDDPDEVGDLVIDRVVEMQAEEGIPIHVIPIRPPERVRAATEAQQASTSTRQPRTIPLLGGFPSGTR